MLPDRKNENWEKPLTDVINQLQKTLSQVREFVKQRDIAEKQIRDQALEIERLKKTIAQLRSLGRSN